MIHALTLDSTAKNVLIPRTNPIEPHIALIMIRLLVLLLAEVTTVVGAEVVEVGVVEEMAEAVAIPQEVLEGAVVVMLPNTAQRMLIVILVKDGQTEFILAQ